MEQLKPLLEKLADTLGTTVEHLWQVMLQQTAIEIQLCNLWMGIFLWGGLAAIIILVLLLVFMIKDSADSEAIGFIVTVIIVVTAIGIIGYYINYSDWLTLTNNPEYWALKEILSYIGGK